MNNILHWDDALAYFGDELEIYRLQLSKATMSTYSLLACRSTETDVAKFVSRNGEHAETQLVMSDIWLKDIDAAISAWNPRDTPMIILMLLNRSPCSNCAHILAAALHKYHNQYALRTERQHFILASLGYYHSNKLHDLSKGQLPQTFSTDRGMRALKEAGWKLCTVNFGSGLTRRGHELHTYLQNMS